MLVRLPGIHDKLDGAWDGPYKVLEVPLVSKKKGSRNHVQINKCKEFHQATNSKVAVSSREECRSRCVEV